MPQPQAKHPQAERGCPGKGCARAKGHGGPSAKVPADSVGGMGLRVTLMGTLRTSLSQPKLPARVGEMGDGPFCLNYHPAPR